VNCPFYFKIGACRHGERCSRLHNKPTESQTLLLKNLYQNPFNQYGPNGQPLFDQKEAQQHFEDFHEDLFVELCKFGEIEELNICSNLGEHLLGNVYIKFYKEESAKKALEQVMGRFYAGRPIIAELSPVTDFREARCRQYDQGDCARGGFCNFMHLREVERKRSRELFNAQRKLYKKLREKERVGTGVVEPDRPDRSASKRKRRTKSRSRSRDRKKRRHRSKRERSRSKSKDKGKDKEEKGDEKKGDRKERREREREEKDKKDHPERSDGTVKVEPVPESSATIADVEPKEEVAN